MIDFATLTLVDYGIVFVLVLSAIMSILRGITREILGLAGWGVSILIANYLPTRYNIFLKLNIARMQLSYFG